MGWSWALYMEPRFFEPLPQLHCDSYKVTKRVMIFTEKGFVTLNIRRVPPPSSLLPRPLLVSAAHLSVHACVLACVYICEHACVCMYVCKSLVIAAPLSRWFWPCANACVYEQGDSRQLMETVRMWMLVVTSHGFLAAFIVWGIPWRLLFSLNWWATLENVGAIAKVFRYVLASI